jgi:meso-butanediol dehydrogenase/(S,S)-butanediol dehydrogenase/diacetyl reductase
MTILTCYYYWRGRLVRELKGVTAIITGGAHGIGAGIVDVMAREGANVVVADVDEAGALSVARRLREEGSSAIGIKHDVTSEQSCADVVAETRHQFGPAEVLVNNAGVTQRMRFVDMQPRDWDRVLDVNLKGVYLTTRAVLPGMIERREGSIVNISSIVGKAGCHPLFSSYVASKFGVIGLTQALAGELAPHGIRVNAVCPGVVRTSMQEAGLRDISAEEGVPVDDVWSDILAKVPLGRPQLPEDIGLTVAFLASSLAKNITGESINVNGGQLMD